MDALASTDLLLVKQRKQWAEILANFEQANRYDVYDGEGKLLYLAAEVGRSFLSRNLLRQMRPFTIHLLRPDGQPVLRLERPFRWFFHRLEVYDAAGAPLGTIQRRWSWVRRIFDVLDGAGASVCRLFGPVLHPWTFQVRRGDETLGAIRKKWSGLLREGFTLADNFGVQLPRNFDARRRALLLGAVFLIDFVYFESKRGGGSGGCHRL